MSTKTTDTCPTTSTAAPAAPTGPAAAPSDWTAGSTRSTCLGTTSPGCAPPAPYIAAGAAAAEIRGWWAGHWPQHGLPQPVPGPLADQVRAAYHRAR